MTKEEFKARTEDLALNVIVLVDSLPRNRTCDVLGRQLLRSGTSVGANYRAACRARSGAEMAAKLGIVEEEADESIYWINLLCRSGNATPATVQPVYQEFHEILSMTIASIKTIRSSKKRRKIEAPSQETR